MSPRRLKIAVLVLTIFGASAAANAATNTYYYGTRVVDGKTWHLYLHENSGQAELWFRAKKDQSSRGDFRAATFKRSKQKIDPKKTVLAAAKTLCDVKRVVDAGKTAVGCGSVVGSAICLSAALPTGGAAAVACSGTLAYATTKGVANCIDGVSQWIATQLAADSDWRVVMAEVKISQGQFAGVIDLMIDEACDQVKKK